MIDISSHCTVCGPAQHPMPSYRWLHMLGRAKLGLYTVAKRIIADFPFTKTSIKPNAVFFN